MPSQILTDLAPELIIQILKSSDSFADLTSISSTSRKMFLIWKMNIDSICEAVLARTVPCYAQARELIEAQEKAEGDEYSVIGYQSAIDRAKWMFKDADIAAYAVDVFQEMIFRKMTRADQKDFIRAYYRATTLATLGEEPQSCPLLLSWNMLDFEQVNDVMKWLGCYCVPSHLRRINVRFDGEVWRRTHTSMIYIRRDRNKVTSKSDEPADTWRPFRIIVLPHTPF